MTLFWCLHWDKLFTLAVRMGNSRSEVGDLVSHNNSWLGWIIPAGAFWKWEHLALNGTRCTEIMSKLCNLQKAIYSFEITCMKYWWCISYMMAIKVDCIQSYWVQGHRITASSFFTASIWMFKVCIYQANFNITWKYWVKVVWGFSKP